MPDPAPPSVLRIVAMAAPAAVAIAVFGVLYGAAARPLIGPELTMLSSVIVFSGATQFTIHRSRGRRRRRTGDPGSRCAPQRSPPADGRRPALVARPVTAEARAARLVPARRELRFHDGGGRAHAARAWTRSVAERTLLVTGICCYARLAGRDRAWASWARACQGLEGVAEALFPVLFVAPGGADGAHLEPRNASGRRRGDHRSDRVFAPDWSALAPVVAGLLVAMPERPPTWRPGR